MRLQSGMTKNLRSSESASPPCLCPGGLVTDLVDFTYQVLQSTSFRSVLSRQYAQKTTIDVACVRAADCGSTVSPIALQPPLHDSNTHCSLDTGWCLLAPASTHAWLRLRLTHLLLHAVCQTNLAWERSSRDEHAKKSRSHSAFALQHSRLEHTQRPSSELVVARAWQWIRMRDACRPVARGQAFVRNPKILLAGTPRQTREMYHQHTSRDEVAVLSARFSTTSCYGWSASCCFSEPAPSPELCRQPELSYTHAR